MTGADHYRAAEQIAVDAAKALAHDNYPPGEENASYMAAIAAAQLHATLAVAAATALNAAIRTAGSVGWAYFNDDIDEWEQAASQYRKAAPGDGSC
jgi:hypothetical protein